MPDQPTPLDDPDPVGRLGLTRRERVIGALIVLLAVGLVAWMVSAFWRPAPPTRVVMSTGAEDGAYQAYALRYREILARSGVELVLKPSTGAIQNLERLRSGEDGVSVALVQGGLALPDDHDQLVSLGVMVYEPMWVFYRSSVSLERFTDLRGLRVAGGALGTGSRKVVQSMLERHGLSADGLPLLPIGGLKAAKALEAGELDVVALVSGAEGAAVQYLLRTTGVSLLSMKRADAYVRQFPVLTRVEIPEGAVDLTLNIPPQATTLVSLKASLVARNDIHPVLIDLLLNAAREVHGGGGMLRRPGEFPMAESPEYPLSADAERFYKNGPSVLQRFLPYWAAVWVQRLVFFGLPLLAVGIPLARVLPGVYSWSVRRRIYRWYGELSFLERAMAQGRGAREAHLKRLGEIEDCINRLRIPASFASEAYQLRAHVAMVRERLHGG